MDDEFIKLCSEGKLDELKKTNIDNINQAFIRCCFNNSLNNAKWLYSLGGVNIHAENEYVFRWSCYFNCLNIVQWLYSLGGIDIHIEYDFAFKNSCRFYEQKELMKWLLSIDKFDDTIIDGYLPIEYYEYTFNLGYLPTDKMIPAYIAYKNKIRNEITEKHEHGTISIFELDCLIDIIMIYV